MWFPAINAEKVQRTANIFRMKYPLTYRRRYIDTKELADNRAIAFNLLFSREQPVSLEIGCGTGHFITEMGIRYPPRNFLANELRWQYMMKGIKKTVNAGADNVFFLRGDIYNYFCFFHNHMFSHIYVNFPDPWFKSKHHKRQLMNSRFITRLTRKLAPGGSLFFVSDYRDYFFHGLHSLKQYPGLRNKFDDYTTALPGYPLSLFEMKSRQVGQPVYYAHFQKVEQRSSL